MSNQAVGSVYASIIEEVVTASRVDFEEGGVDDGVLEELRRGWQQKLSQLQVAGFPWDPKPEPPAPAPAAAPIVTPVPAPPVQPQYSQAQLTPQPMVGGIALPAAPAGLVKQEPAIKQEPGMAGNTSIIPPGRAHEAKFRAQANLQAQFGSRAANSINAIQAGINGPAAKGGAAQPANPQQPYRPGAPQPAGVPNGQPGLPSAQTDGTGEGDDMDYDGVLMRRHADGTLHEMGRVEIDRVLHAQIAANARAMEGGGLMLPLKEATKNLPAGSSSARRERRAVGAAGFDGPDEDEDDEDAINSDLDDPDEREEDDDDEDEGLQHVMLCMYDKVQRVKNKWKCILKDGVLTVNGKEYVFHKATGEYEW